MTFDAGEVVCTVSQEQLAKNGSVLKKSLHKNACLTLGRNEFKDVLLKLNLGKRDFKFRLHDITVHKKFAREGKATIKLVNHHLQFMLSNCPPDKLIMFLKTMTTKLECLKHKGTVSDRKRLTSDLPRTFQEISPLNLQELQTVHNLRAKAEENRADLFTPKGKGAKRKRDGVCDAEKENRPPKVGYNVDSWYSWRTHL